MQHPKKLSNLLGRKTYRKVGNTRLECYVYADAGWKGNRILLFGYQILRTRTRPGGNLSRRQETRQKPLNHAEKKLRKVKFLADNITSSFRLLVVHPLQELHCSLRSDSKNLLTKRRHSKFWIASGGSLQAVSLQCLSLPRVEFALCRIHSCLRWVAGEWIRGLLMPRSMKIFEALNVRQELLLGFSKGMQLKFVALWTSRVGCFSTDFFRGKTCIQAGNLDLIVMIKFDIFVSFSIPDDNTK